MIRVTPDGYDSIAECDIQLLIALGGGGRTVRKYNIKYK
jgi:hypothetical protein